MIYIVEKARLAVFFGKVHLGNTFYERPWTILMNAKIVCVLFDDNPMVFSVFRPAVGEAYQISKLLR